MDKDSFRQPDRQRKLGYSQSSLHAKAFTIDRRYVFVGSFNWDPRSAEINTEMGIFLDSPELTTQVTELFLNRLPNVAYRLALDADGAIEWVAQEKGDTVVYQSEPNTSFWRRTLVTLYKLLPIEDQL